VDGPAAIGEGLGDARRVDGESRSPSVDNRGRLVDGSGLEDCLRFVTLAASGWSGSVSGRTAAEAIALCNISMNYKHHLHRNIRHIFSHHAPNATKVVRLCNTDRRSPIRIRLWSSATSENPGTCAVRALTKHAK
jgi:hypothetical protein